MGLLTKPRPNGFHSPAMNFSMRLALSRCMVERVNGSGIRFLLVIPRKTRHIHNKLYRAKAEAGTELDTLMNASVFMDHKDDDGRHEENTGGLDHYKIIFQIARTGWMYEGVISVEIVEKDSRFHDITRIRDITAAQEGRNALATNGNVSGNSVIKLGRM